MRNRKRSLAFVAAGMAATLLIAACGDDDGNKEGEGPTGGTFSVYIGEPEHLVPTNTNESEGSQVLAALFTGLVEYDAQTTQPRNAVAKDITSSDNVKWTIKLNEGWTFHDGTPVDAQSYVDAWNYGALSTNAQGNSYFFDKIVGYNDLQGDAAKKTKPKADKMSGLKAVDATTIEVMLTSPFSQFPLMLGYTAFYPMPKVAFADIKAYEQKPIGNGPFQMTDAWKHNEFIKVKRYEAYKGSNKGKADEITFKIYSEIKTAYTDLKGGNVDIMDSVPPENITEAKGTFGDRYLERESSSFTYLGFPMYVPKFQNKKLRQAISLAINRQEITDKIFSGTRAPALSVVSPVVAGSRPDACKYCTYDPAKAKQLLQEAGGWTGTMTIWFNSGAGHEDWVQAVSNQLRTNLGITDVKFQSLEFAQYLPKLDDKKITGPFRLGWVMDYPSPQNYLEPLYGKGGSSNNFGYDNPAFDKLIDEGNRAGSINEGISKYQAAEDLLLEDMPVIPMFFGRITGAHTDHVDNVVIDAFGRVILEDVTVNQ